jgi:Cu(I)/Ag(I) efflux system membrane fusion protein
MTAARVGRRARPPRTGARAAAAACAVLLCAVGCRDGSAPHESAQAAEPPSSIVVSPDVVRLLGVRSAPAELAPLSREARAPGVVRYDERSISDIYAPVAGWIERSSVRAVGDPVRAGQLLFELHSPALEAADAQYVRSMRDGASPEDGAYARGLSALGLTDEMIVALRDKRRVPGRIPFFASAPGVATALRFRQGAFVGQYAEILQVTGSDPVWAILSVPVAATPPMRGMPVTVVAPSLPGWAYEGEIDYVYPGLDPTTRSVQARVVIGNAEGVLLPDMYVSATLHFEDAAAVIQIPADAVIRTEHGERVVVDLGDGRYVPRAVQTGATGGDRVAVVTGLQQGERVVTRALFLIDSEASLRTSLARLDGREPLAPVAAPGSHADHHHH